MHRSAKEISEDVMDETKKKYPNEDPYPYAFGILCAVCARYEYEIHSIQSAISELKKSAISELEKVIKREAD